MANAYWAKHFGCGKIAVAATSRRRADLAAAVGATSFFINDDHAVESAVEQLGGMPDIVFECVGVPGMIARAIELVKPRGTVVITGICLQPDSFLPMIAVQKELRVLFSLLYSLGDFQSVVDALEAQDGIAPRAMITDTVSLQAFPAAFEALRERNQQCKVMLAPWS